MDYDEIVAETVKRTLQQLELENCIAGSVHPDGGDTEMIHKTRVLIGKDESGNPISKQVYGSSVFDLNDNVVLTYVKSGRISEFLPNLKDLLPKEEDKKRITFEKYIDKWYETYKKDKIKPTTKISYKSMLNKFLPRFGKMYMDEFKVADLQTFLNDNKDLSKKYLTDMVKFIGMICSDAIEDGYMTVNPAKSRKISIPSDKVNKREAISKEDYLDIMDHIQDLDSVLHRRMLALFCLTGMRRGEALALTWDDIDWEQGVIHITKNAPYINGMPVLGTTKTENGMRDIPIVGNLKELLEPEDGEDGYIIHGRDKNKILPQCSFVRAWNQIEAQIDLHGATPHILRHTFLTLLAGEGVDPKTIQAIAGHGDISITMNRYVHAQNECLFNAAKTFEKSILVKNLVAKNAS